MTRKISSQAEINSIRVKEQGIAPTTPDGGYGQIYEKTDGSLYFKNDTGSEIGLGIDVPGLAGSADRLGAGTTGTISQEYDSLVTGLTWSPSTPSIVDSNTTLPSHLYIKSTDTTDRIGTMIWTPGSGSFDARCKVNLGIDSIAQSATFGLAIMNSGTTYQAVCSFTGQVALQNRQIYALRYTGTSYATVDTQWDWKSTEVYLRITRDNNYNMRWYCSSDGIAWQNIAGYRFVFDVFRIGFYSTDNPHEAYVDWLRAQP